MWRDRGLHFVDRSDDGVLRHKEIIRHSFNTDRVWSAEVQALTLHLYQLWTRRRHWVRTHWGGSSAHITQGCTLDILTAPLETTHTSEGLLWWPCRITSGAMCVKDFIHVCHCHIHLDWQTRAW
jgi:hypothetical protein